MLPLSGWPVLAIVAIFYAVLTYGAFHREPGEGENETDIILLTHRTIEGSVREAIRRIEALGTVLSKVVLIRLEELN